MAATGSRRRADVVVVGVDGCPAGWVAVLAEVGRREWRAEVHRDFADVLAAYPDAASIGVDIPIGLPAEGPRSCDALARRLLGPRRSSVFAPPSRRLLDLIADAADYRAANGLCRAGLGHGIGVQAFNIYPKICQVDALMTPDRQRRVREVHPELCFAAMRGRPCDFPKRTAAGARERMAALSTHFAALDLRPLPMPGAGVDDVLDALAATWTAARAAVGSASVLPTEPEFDPRGLRMEMVF